MEMSLLRLRTRTSLPSNNTVFRDFDAGNLLIILAGWIYDAIYDAQSLIQFAKSYNDHQIYNN